MKDAGCVRGACLRARSSAGVHAPLLRGAESEGWGLTARRRSWCGVPEALPPFSGVETARRCGLWLLQAGCPCSSAQRVPAARAWGPCSVPSPEGAGRRLAVVRSVRQLSCRGSVPPPADPQPPSAVGRGTGWPQGWQQMLA